MTGKYKVVLKNHILLKSVTKQHIKIKVFLSLLNYESCEALIREHLFFCVV
jgi:hypothetical protein